MSTKPRTIADRLSHVAETSFVGRDHELTQLRAALEAPELPFVVAFVHGPGGIGKSSLIGAACRHARPGIRAVALDCRDIEPTPHGFLAALGTALGVSEAEAELDGLVTNLGTGSRRALLTLDTYETFDLMDTWLRQVFVPALPDNVLTIIAGREAPNEAWTTTPGWQGLALPAGIHWLSSSRRRPSARNPTWTWATPRRRECSSSSRRRSSRGSRPRQRGSWRPPRQSGA
jgi:hypothetical protein